MADVKQPIVVGAFSNRKQADDAIIALQKAGFQNDQIRQFAGRGSSGGTLTGIKGIFSSERMARGDVSRDLIDMGVTPEDTPFYQQEYEAGHPLVSVSSSKRLPEATAILLNHDAYVPTAARASGGRMAQKEGKETRETAREAPYAATQERRREAPYAAAGQELHGHLRDEQRMRLHTEQLQAYKQPAQVGEVVLRKELVTEQQTIDVPVSHEEVIIERRPLAEAATGDEVIGESQTIHIPVSEERVNVTKHVVTTGEVIVGKRDRQEVQHFSDTIQHEEARWEQKGDAHIIWEKGTEPPPSQHAQ